MSIQTTIERPDGVRIIVSADEAADVVGVVLCLASRIGAESPPSSVSDDDADRIAARVAEALNVAIKRRIAVDPVPMERYP